MSAILQQKAPLGIIHGLSNEAYHSGPGISKSGLDDMDPPARYYALHLDPSRTERTQTASQRAGTLAHCAILEPEEFGKRYAVGPDCSRATKAWKEWEASLPAGVEAIKPDEYETAMRQRESVLKLPGMAEILSAGMAEVSAFWEDPYTGVLCRCRPDFVTTDALIDLKTVGRGDAFGFCRQAPKLNYHVQDAFYTWGYSASSGEPERDFWFLTVESDYPYLSSRHRLPVEAKNEGLALVRLKMDIYAECLKRNEWPGYPSEIQTVNWPAWALTQET